MAEVGKVYKVDGDFVELVLKRREACGKCRACSAGLTEKEMNMRAKNACGAKVGDNVEVYIAQENFLTAVAIMYGIPFVFFMIGIIGGYYGAGFLGLGNEALFSIGAAVILTAISYIIIHLNEGKWSNGRFLPIASKIADENPKEE